MVEVNLWAGLRAFADGQARVEVEAGTIREMLAALVAAYPGMKPMIDAGVSVAIDGQIVERSVSQSVSPDSEIFLLQQIRGG